MKENTAIELVRLALHKAQTIHPPMRTNHEAYGIIREEFDEWWNAVKAHKNPHAVTREMMKEAIHGAAMFVRFLVDLCPEEIP